MFKWLVKQPVNALKFISRHGRTKMGRTAMTIIAATIANQAGMPGAAEVVNQLPDLAASVLTNPLLAGVGLLDMFYRDRELKQRFSHE